MGLSSNQLDLIPYLIDNSTTPSIRSITIPLTDNNGPVPAISLSGVIDGTQQEITSYKRDLIEVDGQSVGKYYFNDIKPTVIGTTEATIILKPVGNTNYCFSYETEYSCIHGLNLDGERTPIPCIIETAKPVEKDLLLEDAKIPGSSDIGTDICIMLYIDGAPVLHEGNLSMPGFYSINIKALNANGHNLEELFRIHDYPMINIDNISMLANVISGTGMGEDGTILFPVPDINNNNVLSFQNSNHEVVEWVHYFTLQYDNIIFDNQQFAILEALQQLPYFYMTAKLIFPLE